MENNTWTTLTPMPSPNNVPGTAVFSGQLWVYGGGNPFDSPLADALPDAPDTTSACVAYVPDLDSWSACPSLLQQRSFPGGAAVRNMPVALGGTAAEHNRILEATDRSRTVPDGRGLRVIVGGQIGAAFPNLACARGENLDIAEYAFGSGQPATNDFALFDTHDPWSYTTIKDAITETGHTYSEFTPADLAGFPFADYRVVVLNWDDTFLADFESDYEAALPAIEDYVRNGGVVWLQAAVQGTAGDSISLPFGGDLNFELHDTNFIVDPASPLATAISKPVRGTSASHTTAEGTGRRPARAG